MVRVATTFALTTLLLVGGCNNSSTPTGGTGGGGTGSAAAVGASGGGTGSSRSSLGDRLTNAIRRKLRGGSAKSAPQKPLTAASYEQLVIALSSCKLGKRGRILRSCKAYRALRDARSRNAMIKDFAGMSRRLGVKLLRHEAVPVRWYAAGLLKSFFGAKKAAQTAVLAAAPEEKDPHVLARMIYAVGSAAKDNAAVGAWLMKMADHKHKVVRKEALAYLAPAAGVPKRFEKFVEKMQKDPDRGVRRYACRYGGRLGDDRLVKVYAMLTRRVTNEAFYADCLRGLFEMWNPFLGKHKLSAAAYKLTLARLNRRPRTATHPPWIMMSDFGRRPHGSPKWYDEAAVRRMLVSVATDGRARWLARTGAARALGKLKAKKALLLLRKKLGTRRDFDSKNVLKVVQRELGPLL